MLADKELELSHFGEYLLRKHIAPERNAKYYVRWVRDFLERPQDPKLSLDGRMVAFAESLRAANCYEDWQITLLS